MKGKTLTAQTAENIYTNSFIEKAENKELWNKSQSVLSKTDGITLVALVVTIVVLLILAGITIVYITGDNSIFNKATEAAFKTELSKVKEEYEIYVTSKTLKNIDFQKETLNAYANQLYYNTITEEEKGGNIYTVLKNSPKEQVDKLEITNGELLYTTTSERETRWAEEIGIKVNPYMVEDGVLLSSNNNLALKGDATGTLVIPETVKGEPVTAIGAGAFGLTEGIRKVVIPATIKEIRDNAFINNTSIEEVVFETKTENGVEIGLEKIGKNAFRECRNLLSIEMPNTVTSIGLYAFLNCTNLNHIKLSNNIKRIEDQTFSACSLISIEIPDSVTFVEKGAFKNCTNLEKVKMSRNVSSIAGAFDGCSKLAKIDVEGNPNFTFEDGILFNKNKTQMQFILSTAIKGDTFEIPNTVTTIESGLINSYSTQIKKAIIPASVKSINTSFFTDNIDTIEINANNTAFMESEGKIYNKEKTTLYYIYKDGTTLAKNIQSITIDDTVKTIGTYAFYNCRNLKELTIGKNVSNINWDWVWNDRMSKLTTVTIDKENTSYTAEGNAIYNKDKTTLIGVTGRVTQFDIPNSVETIGEKAFIYQALTRITIPKGVESINTKAFGTCKSLEQVEIPNSVTTMNGDAFGGCTSLKSIIIDNSPGSIPDENNNCWGASAGARIVTWLRK